MNNVAVVSNLESAGPVGTVGNVGFDIIDSEVHTPDINVVPMLLRVYITEPVQSSPCNRVSDIKTLVRAIQASKSIIDYPRRRRCMQRPMYIS